MTRCVALVQARMSSTRLPGKVLLDLAGEPLLARVIARARAAHSLDAVIVATTDQPADDAIAVFCASNHIPIFRGSENDVLDRFYRAAQAFSAPIIVRLTADCPLLDPAIIDRVVNTFRTGDYDYVSNTLVPTFPDGLDTEVFSFAALERAWHESTLPSDREHVTPYIWRNPHLFHLGSVKNDTDYSALRWTVDEPRDLDLIRKVYPALVYATFNMNDVLQLLAAHPEWTTLNAGIERNEGYTKSLAQDPMGEP